MSTRIPVIHRKSPPGSAPGTIETVSNAHAPQMTVLGYGPDEFESTTVRDVDEIMAHRNRWSVLWVNIDGLGDPELLQRLCTEFRLHRIALEDVANVPQRAKVDPYDEHLFIVGRMIDLRDHLSTEQVSMFVGDSFVLTFQEREGDSFDQVRHRIRKPNSRIRRSGPDYLAYALIDALVDAYYPVLESYGDRIESLEEEMLAHPDGDFAPRIHALKRDLLIIRRALAPHREALHALLREETEFIEDGTRIYLRSCLDHVVQLLDLVETYRELSTGLLEVHLATISNRMNEVMKVLTIFAAIFIPLSFIAGLYGMNFDQASRWNMPELRWAFGYPLLLTLMLVVAVGLLAYFRRRGWIGTPRRPDRHDEQ